VEEDIKEKKAEVRMADFPQLYVKEIENLYVRTNFQNLFDYFKNNNQLLNFNFVEVVFEEAGTKLISHGLDFIPNDIIRSQITGTGIVTFNRSQFDEENISLTSTGPARVRFYVGSFIDQPDGPNIKTDDAEDWFAFYPTLQTVASATTSSSTTSSVETIVTTNTNYTVATGVTVVIVTAASTATITLPDATTLPGRRLSIIKNENSFVQHSIVPIGGQTVDSTSSTPVSTYKEKVTLIASGTDWIVEDRYIPSKWATDSYANLVPSGAFGTVTQTSYIWRREGDSIRFRFGFTVGTPSGLANVYFALPSGIVIDSTKLSSELRGYNLGIGYNLSTGELGLGGSSLIHVAFYDGSDTANVYSTNESQAQQFKKRSGTDVLSASLGFVMDFLIPVVGWKG
jgi:hypothetical protein